ncbi:hypothetical protein [Cupriavidus sp. H19C3]|uniref:hypothetical protein n=1 Tax=Cupriavidus sp. H19C3 TaxID=3241603 RepID=UPI003BF85AD1
MKKIFSYSITAGWVLIALAGCGSKQDANKSNFKAAIQDYFDKTSGVCVMAPAKAFPFKIEKKDGLRFLKNPDKAAALAKVGLLSETDAEMPSQNPLDKTPLPATEYALTEMGKKYLVPGAGGNIGGWDGFCTGKAKVAEVESFTQPADMFGSKVSQVNFTYEIPDAPDWAKAPEMRTVYPQLNAAAEKARDKTVLIATSEGWMHERLFKNGSRN